MDQVDELQQYTRRYSVVIRGIEKKQKETHNDLVAEVEKVVGEIDCEVTMNDVDKAHITRFHTT